MQIVDILIDTPSLLLQQHRLEQLLCLLGSIETSMRNRRIDPRDDAADDLLHELWWGDVAGGGDG